MLVLHTHVCKQGCEMCMNALHSEEWTNENQTCLLHQYSVLYG